MTKITVWYVDETKNMEKPFRRESLICGCCGDQFHTWEWYEDQDQDVGYGICKGCQEEDRKRNNEEYEKMYNLVFNAMNEKNQKIVLEKVGNDKKFKIVLVNRALEKKIIGWEISKNHT